jgi:hypothetical protein
MYEKYSRQSLPPRKYRELLGSAICVFNSNNQFIIENILRQDSLKYKWHELIDKTSGELSEAVKETISRKSNTKIATAFSELIAKRNRIIHSFQVTHNDEQILRTKNNKGEQFNITEDYLLKFITDNETLSSLLHDFRGF